MPEVFSDWMVQAGLEQMLNVNDHRTGEAGLDASPYWDDRM